MANETTLTKPAAEEAAAAEHTRSGRFYRPHVDILEQPDELLVMADVPGARGDRIDVKFEDGSLSIHAEVDPRQSDDREYLLREYGVGDFYRTFRVSEAVDAGKISAEYADGVLTLHLPKAEAVRPRKIAVKTE
ncbi:MAG: Hsp20/alpha crystallin family protein [Pirellulales bacterium]|nr:Hsp20/alpha crystallin family protein [Pirellulales bacterium]